MRKHLMHLIACPACGGDLQLDVFESPSDEEIETGLLRCTCGQAYPVWKGVPRLLIGALWEFREFMDLYQDKVTQAADAMKMNVDGRSIQVRQQFEFQWHHWGQEERIFGKTLDQMIENLTNERIGSAIDRDFYPGKVVLDAGCGHGRYLTAFSQLGAEVVGLDIGSGIEIAHRYNQGKPGIHLVQGDIMHLPLRGAMFDLVFSDGVIHHTPSTRDAFFALAEMVKPGGYLYIWVYPKGGSLWEFSQRAIRCLTTRLPRRLLYYLCFIPVPLLSIVRTYSGTSLRNSSWRQCAQVVWDWYSPKYQWHHTEEEVQRWYQMAGFEPPVFLPVPVGAIGQKPGGAEA